MKYYIRYILCILMETILILPSVFTYVYAEESVPAPPGIVAEAGVVIEASTGTVLYNKNMDNHMYPASITKIMTALLTLENCSLDEMVNFYHYDVYSLVYGDAHIGMQENEQISVLDCLYGVMLASANECANACGEHVARKTAAFTETIEQYKAKGETYDESQIALSIFADMMNERAKKAGAKNTHFTNPSGLFHEEHYTTCYDMAMITRAVIEKKDFLEIESNTYHKIEPTNITAEARGMSNRHKMLYPDNPNYYQGILGGKTGYVDQSGNTLVTFAERDGVTLISVVMKTNAANVYNDTRLLLDYGFANYKTISIAEYENTFSKFNQFLFLDRKAKIAVPKSVSFENINSDITFNKPVKNGHTLATIDYSYNGNSVGKIRIRLKAPNTSFYTLTAPLYKNTAKDTPAEKEKHNFIFIWIVITIILLAFITILIYNHFRKKRRLKSATKKHV